MRKEFTILILLKIYFVNSLLETHGFHNAKKLNLAIFNFIFVVTSNFYDHSAEVPNLVIDISRDVGYECSYKPSKTYF
jgi:hypothetical protein